MTVKEHMRAYANVMREDNINYATFLRTYLEPNLPVILGRDLVASWPASSCWIASYTGQRTCINWAHLSERYGDQEISVSDCSKADSFENLVCRSARFLDVVSKWQRGEGGSLYVKDWHLPRTVESQNSASDGEHQAFYTTPDVFKDDWMNSYYSAQTSDDFRFVYVGAAGTFTPLHRDVYCSYSWSTNVCGRKRWWLFPPEQTSYLFMPERNVAVHDVRHVDEAQFPQFRKAVPMIVEQETGETIFVPSGWYHQVENLTDCISINHNWCNSVNLPSLYSSMCDKVTEVEYALEDVRLMLKSSSEGANEKAWKLEFTNVVQELVKQDAGWNWLTFWKMVAHALRAIVEPTNSLEQLQVHKPSGRQPLFAPASVDLRPSDQFIHDKVKWCHDNFIQRDRMECEGEVAAVVEIVEDLLIQLRRNSSMKSE